MQDVVRTVESQANYIPKVLVALDAHLDHTVRITALEGIVLQLLYAILEYVK